MRGRVGMALTIIGIGWLVYWGVGFVSFIVDNSNSNFLHILTFINNLTGAIAGAFIVIGIMFIRRKANKK